LCEETLSDDGCGLDPVSSVVTGADRGVRSLVNHDEVAMSTFTGSPEVGWRKPGIGAAHAGIANSAIGPAIIAPEADLDANRPVDVGESATEREDEVVDGGVGDALRVVVQGQLDGRTNRRDLVAELVLAHCGPML
jgi:hypothetical protein